MYKDHELLCGRARYLPVKVALVLICCRVVLIGEDFAQRSVLPSTPHGICLSGPTEVQGVAMETAGAVWNPRGCSR
eukprot:6117236-Amphidinium_carterae.1